MKINKDGRKTKTQKLLPKTVEQLTNGSVHSQSVRCGKGNCKCSNGDTHTAYYFFTRIDGKLSKFYIRKSEVKAFKTLVNQAQRKKANERITNKHSNKLLSRYRSFLFDNAQDIQQSRKEVK